MLCLPKKFCKIIAFFVAIFLAAIHPS
jgi:hypothetical protein